MEANPDFLPREIDIFLAAFLCVVSITAAWVLHKLSMRKSQKNHANLKRDNAELKEQLSVVQDGVVLLIDKMGIGPDSVQPELDSSGHKVPNHYVLKAETGTYKITGGQAEIIRKVVTGQASSHLSPVTQKASGKVTSNKESD